MRGVANIDVVIVGLGGIFYAASSALRGLLDQYARGAGVAVMDDDRIETTNWTRQWRDTPEGLPKVQAASTVLGRGAQPPRLVVTHGRRFMADTRMERLVQEFGEGDRRLLVLCLPDNDAARVAVAKECAAYAKRKPCRVVSITCGCDMEKGQALMGIYDRGGPLMNVLKRHPDIGQPLPSSATSVPCSANAQSLYSNVLTASLLTPLFQYALTSDELWTAPKPVGLEGYWSHPTIGVVRKPEVWVSEVEC